MPDEDGLEGGDESGVLKELRSKAKRADDAETEATQLRTELAIARAGLDLTPARQKALLAAHEGDMDAESIRKTAVDLGFAEPPAPEPPQVTDDEKAAHERMQQATAGAESAEAQPETLEQRIAKAKTSEELDEILAGAGITVNSDD